MFPPGVMERMTNQREKEKMAKVKSGCSICVYKDFIGNISSYISSVVFIFDIILNNGFSQGEMREL